MVPTTSRSIGASAGLLELQGSEPRGNTALAGHRDGFFRPLKDISVGASLELVTPDSIIHYKVEKTEVVTPDDVSVLADLGSPALTLVTCFPFYFVGNAPQRFIVQAKATNFHGPATQPNAAPRAVKSNLKR